MFFFLANSFIRIRYFLFIVTSSLFYISCSTVKNYKPGKPFVYQTTISINGKFTTDERKQLIDQLDQQLDDSVRVRKQQKLIFFNTLKNPPAYDSANVEKSIISMRALMNSLGYYRDTVRYTATVDTVNDDEFRTSIHFLISPGILIRLDSIRYHLSRDSLEQITLRSLDQALIKKGQAFAKPLISSEFDRLSDIYRDNGYLKFSKEDLLALWDTVGLNLLRPTFDPIEQAQLLEALRKKKMEPTADLEIVFRPNADTSRFTRYYVGAVTVFPDYGLNNIHGPATTEMAGEYRFVYYEYLYKPKKFTDFIYLHRGDLYRQSNYLKTQNKFGTSLGAWRLVNIIQLPRPGQDSVDIELRLTPAKKFAFTANLEASKNQGNVLLVGEGNLIGLGVTLALINRNFAKAANQATTNLRYGTELNASSGASLVQTTQFSATHNIEFPRAVPRNLIPARYRENTRTLLSLNAGNTDRLDYYSISSFNASWGYEFNWKNKLLTVRFPNVEYNLLTRRKLLDTLIKNNASYKYIFNDGLILSTIINLKVAVINKNISNLTNIGVETSGLVLGTVRNQFLDSNLYRFIRLDAQFSQTQKIRRTAFAWRIFGGIGFEMSSSHNRNNLYLPFFREYYAGGPNSMRAWPLRKLGPGSSIKSFAREIAPDRFGDLRLEANAEYRFYMTKLFGFNAEGAFFTDAGNVWFLHNNPDFPGGEFHFSNLWKDLAIGTGTGLRIDFGFLKARFDYAFKVKNPNPDDISQQNKWFYNWKIFNGQFQLGIDYPF